MGNEISFRIELPQYSDVSAFISQCNQLIVGRDNIYSLLNGIFDQQVQRGDILSYKSRRSNKNFLCKKVGEIDFCADKSAIGDNFFFADFRYNFVFPLNPVYSPVQPFNFETATTYNDYVEYLENYGYNSNLFLVNDPWYIKLDKVQLKTLKTQQTQTLDFSLYIKRDFFVTKLIDSNMCTHEFRLMSRMSVWNWKLVWGCIHCGLVCHCACFSKALKVDGGEKYSFVENACEVCRGVPSTHQYCHEMYARSDFEIRYGAYVKKKSIELKYSDAMAGIELKDDRTYEREASNLVREELGFKKIGDGFVVETELYRLVRSVFSEYNVIHHYRSTWLGRQEIDIYIEELKIGIEYQGEQHYRPISHWGGHRSLQQNRERDKRKKRLCQENGVTLIEFTYQEKDFFNLDFVRNRINKA